MSINYFTCTILILLAKFGLIYRNGVHFGNANHRSKGICNQIASRDFSIFYVQLKVMERQTKDEEENRVKQQKEKLVTILSQVVAEKKFV